MQNIYLTSESYEEARKKGQVGELRLLAPALLGINEDSLTEAYTNLRTKAHEMGATAIFNREPKTSGSPSSKDLIFMVTGDAYGPRTQKYNSLK